MFDLLITGGRIIDGTGNTAFYGAVGVEGDRVRILRGDISGVEAAKVIDATGSVTCPGFIDMHAHSGLMVLAEPQHLPKITQGVTTELIGVDGNSYAPITSPDDFSMFLLLNAGLDGNPPLPKRWSTVAEYLSLFDNQVSCNYAYVIGNSALRISALGWEDRQATSKELENMKALTRQGMEEGAFGISTGLDYPPGSYADTEELVELCKQVNRLGGIYVTHVRSYLGDRFLDPYREGIEIGRRSGVPVHISHFQSPRPGGAKKLLELVDEAHRDELDVTFDAYPYIYSSSRLEMALPQWAHDGGTHRLLELMRSPEGRQKMAPDLYIKVSSWHEALVTNLKKPHNKRFDGRSMADIAEMTGKPMIDALCDLLLEEEMDPSYVGVVGNPVNVREFFRHPAGMVGSDALLIGDHPSPRTYGTFPTILGDLVREENILDLPQAIRKMTSAAATRLGLSDRGVLRTGMKADVVVFSPERVRAPATIHEPRQFCQGIDHVIVNGVQVIEKGQHTGALPGRALRRGES